MNKFVNIPRTGYININIPVKRGISSAFSATADTMEAAKNNLRALLLTNVGERLHSDFGTRIKELVFDPIDDSLEKSIKEEIKMGIAKFMPYLELTESRVSFDPKTQNRFDIFIRFKLKNSEYEEQLNIIV